MGTTRTIDPPDPDDGAVEELVSYTDIDGLSVDESDPAAHYVTIARYNAEGERVFAATGLTNTAVEAQP